MIVDDLRWKRTKFLLYLGVVPVVLWFSRALSRRIHQRMEEQVGSGSGATVYEPIICRKQEVS